jgi:hypothetical protein
VEIRKEGRTYSLATLLSYSLELTTLSEQHLASSLVGSTGSTPPYSFAPSIILTLESRSASTSPTPVGHHQNQDEGNENTNNGNHRYVILLFG